MPRHTSKTRALRALGLLAITLAVGSPTVVEANGPDSADTNAFPRCQLDAIQRDQFHQRYGAGHLAMAQGNLSKAQLAFEDALRLCVDDEVLWFLSIVHEDMGEKETANRYRASWVMQRRLYGLDETPPTGATKWTAEAKTPEKPTPTHILANLQEAAVRSKVMRIRAVPRKEASDGDHAGIAADQPRPQ